MEVQEVSFKENKNSSIRTWAVWWGSWNGGQQNLLGYWDSFVIKTRNQIRWEANELCKVWQRIGHWLRLPQDLRARQATVQPTSQATRPADSAQLATQDPPPSGLLCHCLSAWCPPPFLTFPSPPFLSNWWSQKNKSLQQRLAKRGSGSSGAVPGASSSGIARGSSAGALTWSPKGPRAPVRRADWLVAVPRKEPGCARDAVLAVRELRFGRSWGPQGRADGSGLGGLLGGRAEEAKAE